MSVLAFLGAISLVVFFYQSYQWAREELARRLTDRVDQDFKTERIRKTVEEVASAESKAMMRNEITPEVEAFKAKTDARVQEFETFLAELRSRYGSDHTELSALVSRTDARVREFETFLTDLKARYEKEQRELSAQLTELNARNAIAALGDQATSERDRDAYNTLLALKLVVSDDRILKLGNRPVNFRLGSGETIPIENRAMIAAAATAEISRVKKFWIGISGIKAWRLSRDAETKLTKIRKEEEEQSKVDPPVSTKDLLAALTHEDWVIRCLAAQELGRRKEVGVPDALLKQARDDRNLEVSRDAVDAFEQVTGYVNPDVFGWDFAKEWWAKHADEVNAKLKKPEDLPPVAAADPVSVN